MGGKSEKWFLDLDSRSFASSVTDNLLNTGVILHSFSTLKHQHSLQKYIKREKTRVGRKGSGGERRK